jgi:hypothetical protein
MTQEQEWYVQELVIQEGARVRNDLNRSLAAIAGMDHAEIRGQAFITASARAASLALTEWYGPPEAARILRRLADMAEATEAGKH